MILYLYRQHLTLKVNGPKSQACICVFSRRKGNHFPLLASCITLPLFTERRKRAGFTVAASAAAASPRLWHLVKQVTGVTLKCGPSIRLMSWSFNACVHPRP